MTMLSVQSLLLILAAFVAGAMIACFLRRVFFVRDNERPTPGGGRDREKRSEETVTTTTITKKTTETQTVSSTEASRFGRALTGTAAAAGAGAITGTFGEAENSDAASALHDELSPSSEATVEGQTSHQSQAPASAAPSSGGDTTPSATATSAPAALKQEAETQTHPNSSEPTSSESIVEAAATAVVGAAAVASAAGVSARPTPPEAPSQPTPATDIPTTSSTAYFQMLRSVRSEALIGSEDKAADTDNVFRLPTAHGADVADLKRIRGIGVLIEKKLNAMGVKNYEQIANWTAEDVGRVSETLDFKGRIERESWIEQARILASGGYTEFSRRG